MTEYTGLRTPDAPLLVPLIESLNNTTQPFEMHAAFYAKNNALNPEVREFHANLWIETGENAFNLNAGENFYMGALWKLDMDDETNRLMDGFVFNPKIVNVIEGTIDVTGKDIFADCAPNNVECINTFSGGLNNLTEDETTNDWLISAGKSYIKCTDPVQKTGCKINVHFQRDFVTADSYPANDLMFTAGKLEGIMMEGFYFTESSTSA